MAHIAPEIKETIDRYLKTTLRMISRLTVLLVILSVVITNRYYYFNYIKQYNVIKEETQKEETQKEETQKEETQKEETQK